jgi:branched-subunit amino acid transport protein
VEERIVSEVELLAIIALGGVLTYLTRLSFIALIPHQSLPQIFRSGLRFVPPAVLAAIILPALLLPADSLDFSTENHRLLAGVVAIFVGWRSRNIWLTIAAGMLTLWILNALI